MLVHGFIALALLAPTVSIAASDPLDDVNQSAREWIKLRLETKQIDTAWRSERELLESTLAALKERASALEEKRALALTRTAKEREELDGLRAKKDASADDLKACEARLRTLAEKLLALRPNLPPRLSDALELSYRSLVSADLGFAERLEVAMTMLNRCAQFNHVITTGEDVLTLDGESAPKSLDTIYWGLSHGFALDRAGHKAWLGRPGATGWRWEPQPEIYDRVAKLLAMARDRADPEFIVVPAEISRSLAAQQNPAP